MKNISGHLLIALSVALLTLSCNEETYIDIPIELSPEKHDNSVYVGDGIWLVVPSSYRKAKSYHGFQSTKTGASLSVETRKVSLIEVRNSFNQETLKLRNTELLEMRPVKFGDIDSALFIVVQDNRKGTIRYLLAIDDGAQTYLVKGFCFKRNLEQQNGLLRNAIFSTYIGEVLVEEKLFKIAAISDINNLEIVYTKDGEFPTLFPDSSTIKIRYVKKMYEGFARDLIKEELLKLTGVRAFGLSSESYTNGSIMSGQTVGRSTKAFASIITTQSDSSTLVVGYGNLKAKTTEFAEFVKINYSATTIASVSRN